MQQESCAEDASISFKTMWKHSLNWPKMSTLCRFSLVGIYVLFHRKSHLTQKGMLGYLWNDGSWYNKMTPRLMGTSMKKNLETEKNGVDVFVFFFFARRFFLSKGSWWFTDESGNFEKVNLGPRDVGFSPGFPRGGFSWDVLFRTIYIYI